MDVAKFEQFLTLYEKDIYTFCLYLARNQQAAEDLYQETILFAFEKCAEIDFQKNPKSYLLAIAAGKWKNAVRKASWRAKIAPELPLDFTLNASDNANDLSHNLEKQELQTAINKGLNALTEKLRVPLILHYYEDLSIEEIAGILEIPAGTIKSRLHNARKTMKKFLEREGINEYRE
ncbi:MAG: RNA polymerase sigma factor [Firmicutes bacterium]|nr:RNA polymerase sigma factor [Bacillota bacterium]